jgi:SagB-type dehydrogenase family enzyme
MNPSPSEVYTAVGLRQKTRQFSTLALPLRPKFIDTFLYIATEDVLYVFGGQPQKLRSPTLPWIMTELVPLLTGEATVDEIIERLVDVSISSLLDVLHLLHMHGFIEEGADGLSEQMRHTLDLHHRQVMAFYSRYLRVTGEHNSRYGVQGALHTSRVAVAGLPDCVHFCVEQLSEAGIGEVHALTSAELTSKMHTAVLNQHGLTSKRMYDLVLYLGEPFTQDQVVRACMTANIPLLPVDPRHLTVGPLMCDNASACPTCVQLQTSANSSEQAYRDSAVESLWQDALLSYSTQQVIAFLTGVLSPSLIDRTESWPPRTESGSYSSEQIMQLPNCPVCGSRKPPLTDTLPFGHRENAALLFHSNASLKPAYKRVTAAFQYNFSPAVEQLSNHAYLSYPFTERVTLPASSSALNVDITQAFLAESVHPRALDRTALGMLLRYSGGARCKPAEDNGYSIQRHTASAGNLGSGEIFAAVNILDLTPRLCHYLATEDVIELLPWNDTTTRNLVNEWFIQNSISLSVDGEPHWVLFFVVSATERVCAKYSDRGYVYCLLDAGLIAHRISFLAETLGLMSELVWTFDDAQVNQILGVDGVRFAPAVAVIVSDSTTTHQQNRRTLDMDLCQKEE